MKTEVSEILQKYNELKNIRDGYWLNVWREVRRFVMPASSDYKVEGGQRGAEIFDTTAIDARQRLASGIYNWMAPPDKRWFEIKPADDDLAKNELVQDYFAQVTQFVALHMANSNWPSALIDVLNELACGMDGVIYCEEGDSVTPLNFRCFPIESVCYSEDRFGRPDTVFHEEQRSSRQLLQAFPEGLPDSVRQEAADPRRCEQKHPLLHAVFPRETVHPGMADNRNFPYADIYILTDLRKIVREGGFMEFPFAVCRFMKHARDSYGRGPGLNKLPDIKMLNRMRECYLRADEQQADPPWLAPDGSITSPEFSTRPGSMNFYKPDIAGHIPEQIVNRANLQQLYKDIMEEREVIKAGFYADLFNPLGDLRQMTATEAEIRNENAIVPFAPVAGNLHSELFRVVIQRVYGILFRAGRLPELPEILLDRPEYKIDFVSKIAQSLRKVESIGWLQTEASLATLAQMKPDIIDNFRTDDIARDIASANGANPKWLVTVKERDAIRQQRAQAAAQQQAAETMMAGAATLGQNLGKAPEPGSPLGMVMNNTGV